MNTRTVVPCTFASLLAVGLLAGCSTGGAKAGAEAPSGENQAITIAVPPTAFAATLYLGVDQGIFEEAGFDVTLEPSTSMAETVPLLLSGEYDYIYGDLHNTLIAASEGVPIVMTAPLTTTAAEDSPEPGFGNVLVGADSDIADVADLAGAKIGTNSINGQAMLDAIEVLGRQGVETDGIEWVAIPGPQMGAALGQGQVDAITVSEPFSTALLADGSSEFILSLDGGLFSTPMAGLTTLSATVDADADAAARLQDAMIEANEAAVADPQLAYDAMAGFMELPPEIIDESVQPLWAVEPFTPDAAEPVLERLTRLGLLADDRTPDLAAVLPEL